MSIKGTRTLQALVLAILGLFLILKIYDGRILLYINQRFIALVLFAAVGLIILSQIAFQSTALKSTKEILEHAEETVQNRTPLWSIWLIALPILIALFIPERPLGAYAVDTRGMNSNSPLAPNQADRIVLDVPPGQRNVLDWIRIFQSVDDINKLSGEPADITGFVYLDPRLPTNQIMVGRFTITCCVADAVALGIVVETTQAAILESNTWVRVKGKIQVIQDEEKLKPLLQAIEVETIPEPAQPYLFP
jgi:uncharacterized repeat protein (TIGR03943 family)